MRAVGVIVLILSILAAIFIAIIFFLAISLLVYGILLIIRTIYLSRFYDEREDKTNGLHESEEYKD